MPVNICLIGLGYMGRIHLEKLINLEDVNVLATVDIDEKKGTEISDKYNLPFLNDYRELFKTLDDIHGVIISSPTNTHFEIATYFMEKGVHVFIEKPMVKNSIEAEKLLNLTKKTGVILQVGHLERFNPAFKKALEYIKEPLMIEAKRTGPHTGRSTDIDVIFDLMIHDIDLMLCIIKEDSDCTAKVFGMELLNNGLDVATAIMEFKNGCKGILHANRVSSKKERSLNVFEKDRAIYIDLLNGTVTILAKNKDKGIDSTEYNAGKIDSVREELKEFIHAIAGKITPTVEGIDGLKAIKLAELIRSSLER